MPTKSAQSPVRKVSLTASQAGMTRLRDKGGASNNTLNELTNGYVNAARTPIQRQGTTWIFNYADPRLSKSGNAGLCKGLMSWQGMLWTFAAAGNVANLTTAPTSGLSTVTTSAYTVPNINMTGTFTVSSATNFAIGMMISVNDGTTFLMGKITNIASNTITLRTTVLSVGLVGNKITSGAIVQANPILILRHPSSTSATLKFIHYAKPFMGYPYVVAEFSDGVIGHYWLQSPPSWQQATAYNANTLVQPNPAISPNPPLNGFYYKCIQQSNPPAWTPLLQHQVFDIVQPTSYNGFQEQAYSIVGATGVSTTSATGTIPAINASGNITVASSTGFVAGTIVTIVIPGSFQQLPLGVFTALVNSTGAGTMNITTKTAIVGNPGGYGTTITISYILARSGSTEPTWLTPPLGSIISGTSGPTTIDVSSSSPPPVAAAPTTQPNTQPPGTGVGGKYTNIGGNTLIP